MPKVGHPALMHDYPIAPRGQLMTSAQEKVPQKRNTVPLADDHP